MQHTTVEVLRNDTAAFWDCASDLKHFIPEVSRFNNEVVIEVVDNRNFILHEYFRAYSMPVPTIQEFAQGRCDDLDVVLDHFRSNVRQNLS